MHEFPVGATVAVTFLGVLKHVGVISNKIIDGKPTVISASRRTGIVQEEVFDNFSEGKVVEQLDLSGSLVGVEVVRRARSRIGQKYNLLFSNCEHFVRWCHGLKVESKQLQVATTAIVLFAFAILIFKKKKLG